MKPKSQFSQSIITHYKAKGMSREQLAEASDISVDTLNQWINRGSEPRLYNIMKLLKGLGITFEELTSDVDIPDKLW